MYFNLYYQEKKRIYLKYSVLPVYRFTYTFPPHFLSCSISFLLHRQLYSKEEEYVNTYLHLGTFGVGESILVFYSSGVINLLTL